MTAPPSKLYDAFEKMRLGRIEEGTKVFDKIDGFDEYKAFPLAEISYFRHDWKNGIAFARDFIDSEMVLDTRKYHLPRLSEIHLQLFLVATCQLDSWKESRGFLENMLHGRRKGNWDWRHSLEATISLLADPENTRRMLTETRPKLRTEGKEDAETLQWYLHQGKREKKNTVRMGAYYNRLVHRARQTASSENHAAFYEVVSEQLDNALDHVEAALTFIALEDFPKAKEALRRYMRCWKHHESHQVAPVILFTDYELWPVMSDRKFTASLLSIPHHRE